MAIIVVSDTSILCNLAIAEQLDLLPQIYGRVLIPTAVAAELQRGSEDEPRIATALSPDWLEICQQE